MNESPKTWSRKTLEKKENESKIANPEATDTGPTIIDLLHNEEDSRLLFQMVDTKIDAMRSDKNKEAMLAFAARIRSGQLDEKDDKEIQKLRSEFLETKERVRSLSEEVEKRMVEMCSKSPSLNAACVTWGREKYVSIIQQGLLEKAFKNPTEFKKIEGHLELIAASEKAIDDPNNPFNKRVTEFQQKVNASDYTVTNVISEKDPAKRIEQIQRMYREQMGWWSNVRDWWRQSHGGTSTLDTAKDLSKTIDDQKAGLDTHMELIEKGGGILTALVSKNPELRNALMTMKPEEDPKLKGGIDTTMSFAEAKEQPRTVSEKETTAAWHTYKEDHGLDTFKDMDPWLQEKHRGAFIDRFTRQKTEKVLGFWAKVFIYLLTNKIKTDPKLKNTLN